MINRFNFHDKSIEAYQNAYAIKTKTKAQYFID
jgi:hypothetical protein